MLLSRRLAAPFAAAAPAAFILCQGSSEAELIAKICPYGLPSAQHVKVRSAYVLAADRRTRNPRWVAEVLTRASVAHPRGGGGADRKRSKFEEDESEPAGLRARLQDYHRSGYDRGHMAPAGDVVAAGQDALVRSWCRWCCWCCLC